MSDVEYLGMASGLARSSFKVIGLIYPMNVDE